MSCRVTEGSAKVAAPSEKMKKLRFKRGIYRINDDGDLEKRCSKCKEYWPADSEFFYACRAGDGLGEWCKACHVEWRFPDARGAVGHQFGKHQGQHHAA